VPTVFISYAHDNQTHQEKVRILSDRLRKDEIDASIDAYEQHPSEGWPKWMEKQLEADFIIVTLSTRYVQEFKQKVPSSSGARYEGAILSSILHSRGLSFDRLAIVIFDEYRDIDVPAVLHGCTRYYPDRYGEYEKLHSFLIKQPLILKPALGQAGLSQPGSTNKPPTEKTFSSLCNSLQPLVEENTRIFEDFGPNSGADGTNKIVRHDLGLWYPQREIIGSNNNLIAQHVRSHFNVIPAEHKLAFRKWLSHIEAYAAHLADPQVDYREHQFPKEVVAIIRGQS